MPIANSHEEMTQCGYKIDLWDALHVLETITMPKGKSAGARAVRKALYNLYDELRKRIPDINSEDIRSLEHVWKNELTESMRSKAHYYCHQLSAAWQHPEWTKGYLDECYRLCELYSVLHDKFRDEL